MIIYGLDKDNDGNPDGVWILQNSWNGDEYDEYYITYSSRILELFGVRKIIDRNWDNCYNISNCGNVKLNGVAIKQDSTVLAQTSTSIKQQNSEAITGDVVVTYNKPNFKKEKLKMINFVSASQNSKYKVYISVDGTDENYQLIKEVNTDLPGLYSVEIENDIILSSEKFSIKVATDNGALYTIINAFTCNYENIMDLENITSYIDDGGYNQKGNYEYYVISNVQNIEDGQLFKYSLKNENGEILLSNVSKSSVIRNGQAIGKIEFTDELEIGKKYYISIIYNENVVDTLEIIHNPKYPIEIEGNGTEEEPYIIRTAEQLSKISYCPKAYYILENDIDLTYNPDVDVTFNKGMGWIPIKQFSGNLDGKNHTINNMNIISKDISTAELSEVGLFAEINDATISNLKIKNAEIVNLNMKNSNIGILAGKAENVEISNIMVSGSIKNGISSYIEGGIGLLIGNIEGKYNSSLILNNITCQGNIDSERMNHVGGMVGSSLPEIIVDNSLVTTIITNKSGNAIGGILGYGRVTSVKNSYIISNLDVKNTVKIDIIDNNATKKLTELKNVVVYENNHATSIEEFKNDANNNIISSNNIEDLKNITLAQSGLDSQKWEYINGNPYPTLKGQQIKFAKDIDVPSEISLNKEETKALGASIKDADSTYTKLEYRTSDASIVNIDENGNITAGNTNGTATITLSTCDGSYITKEVKATVGEVIAPYKINKYDSDEEKKTISNIFPATIEYYKENINIQNPYTTKVFQGEEEVTEGNIATGMITKIYLNDEIVAEYTNIVPGDVYADGKVSARDAGMIYQYFVGMLENFYGTPQYYAMDFSRDGKIRLNDAELIKRYGVKLYEPSEEDYYGENN